MVCLEGITCAAGLASGLFIGQRLGRKGAGKQEEVQQHGKYSNQSSAYSEEGRASDDGSYVFLNDTIAHMWPHLKKMMEDEILRDVEPKLQESMPGPLKSIRFTKVSLGHAGHCPIKLSGLDSQLDERKSVEHGAFRCVQMLMNLNLESDCEIRLQHSGASCGVSDLKLKGSLVVELYNLIDESPLYKATRVYFSDRPEVDLKMIGGVGGILNTGFLKDKIIEVVRDSISETCVLPQRIVTPNEDNVRDLIKMMAPRPDGILRLVVDRVSGLAELLPSHDTNWYAHFTVGQHRWRTPTRCGADDPSWTEDNVVDFVVHAKKSQHVEIVIYPEIKAMFGGTYAGEPLGRCMLPIGALQTKAESQWFALQEVHSDKRSCFFHSKARKISDHAQEGHESSLKISLGGEWGILSRKEEQAEAILAGSSLFSGWIRPRAGGLGYKDAKALLLIGLRRSGNLRNAQAYYWCDTTVTHVATGEFDNLLKRDGSVTFKSAKVRAERPAKKITSETAAVAAEASEEEQDDAESAEMLEATWNACYFVPLYDPHAKVEVTLHSDKGGIMGTVQHGVKGVLWKAGLEEDFDDLATRHRSSRLSLSAQTGAADVSPGRSPQRRKGTALKIDTSTESPSPTNRPGGEEMPNVHVFVKVWMLEAGTKVGDARTLLRFTSPALGNNGSSPRSSPRVHIERSRGLEAPQAPLSPGSPFGRCAACSKRRQGSS